MNMNNENRGQQNMGPGTDGPRNGRGMGRGAGQGRGRGQEQGSGRCNGRGRGQGRGMAAGNRGGFRRLGEAVRRCLRLRGRDGSCVNRTPGRDGQAD